MANHTATHLLQSALRKVLGEHVRQTGSLVDAEHLRFDFTHMHKMSQREIERVEQLVNDSVKSAIVVTKEIKDIESAKSEGAIALFGEKYGKKVRVVTVAGISKEFCGGTHVDNTKEIEIFKIIGESSIASGVRRIEALTGQAANRWIDRQKEEEESKAKLEKEKEGQKKHYEARLKEEACNIDMMISRAKSLGGSKAVVENIKDINMEGLRMLSDRIKDRAKSAVIVLSTVAADKASFVTAVTEDLVKKGLTASFLAKEVAMILDGSGGGKPGFAQGGGKDPSKLDAACNRALEIIKEKLS